MTQTDELRRHLKAGRTITPLEALNRWGVFRLAARIRDLKDGGMKISSRIASRNGKRFAEYWVSR